MWFSDFTPSGFWGPLCPMYIPCAIQSPWRSEFQLDVCSETLSGNMWSYDMLQVQYSPIISTIWNHMKPFETIWNIRNHRWKSDVLDPSFLLLSQFPPYETSEPHVPLRPSSIFGTKKTTTLRAPALPAPSSKLPWRPRATPPEGQESWWVFNRKWWVPWRKSRVFLDLF